MSSGTGGAKKGAKVGNDDKNSTGSGESEKKDGAKGKRHPYVYSSKFLFFIFLEFIYLILFLYV